MSGFEITVIILLVIIVVLLMIATGIIIRKIPDKSKKEGENNGKDKCI